VALSSMNRSEIVCVIYFTKPSAALPTNATNIPKTTFAPVIVGYPLCTAKYTIQCLKLVSAEDKFGAVAWDTPVEPSTTAQVIERLRVQRVLRNDLWHWCLPFSTSFTLAQSSEIWYRCRYREGSGRISGFVYSADADADFMDSADSV